uniref:VWFA domain-containing protein n=1 Tax=Corethron hystrix TaxID=216773 RepID=A0A7S1B8Y3_9STRA|mmetsp:Transcript_17378/g.39225  ORF Transcript_17378/g.39225 Transcript_17378/m.39225 type:complete len:387 (+) Transcript_17378:213-1373(+)
MSDQQYVNSECYPPPVAPPLEGSPKHQRYNLPRQESARIQDSEEKTTTLRKQGFPEGLVNALTTNILSFPLRIWVVDNSGSMQIGDGNRITGDQHKLKFIKGTRWHEIQDCVMYHSEMAGLLEAPTVFRMLNDPGYAVGPQQFSIAEKGKECIPDEMTQIRNTLHKCRPGGVTPLTGHLRKIRSNIEGMAPSLRSEGKRVAVIIATDGIPTDGVGYQSDSTRSEFVNALRGLEGLPVWVVIRLCTDEEAVVDFYNEIDEQLELNIDVLDDFVGEAAEVYQHNKWLNYALPLHRCREMGFHDRLFDLLDEHTFTAAEVRDFCALLFGSENFEDLPDPNIDWDAFKKALKKLNDGEKLQWNPIKKKATKWVDLSQLDKMFGPTSCVIS